MKTNCILRGDNVKILSTFPDECIDLTVTSPPYDDMDEDFIPIQKGGLRSYNGYSWNFKGLAAQLYRVTKPGGVVVWVINDPTIDGSESLASSLQKIYFRRMGFNIHDTMIYKCDKPPVNDRRYQPSTEYMIILSKGYPRVFHPIMEDLSISTKGRRRYKMNSSFQRDKAGEWKKESRDNKTEKRVKDNVWEYFSGYSANDSFSSKHPAVFPEDLARDHILSWSNAGDIVLDPFSGSGTTPKKAKELGRPYVGIEISEEYCNLSESRLAATNPPLFVLEVE